MGLAIGIGAEGGCESLPPKRPSGTSEGWALMRRSDGPKAELLVEIDITDRNISLMHARAAAPGSRSSLL